MLSGSSGLAFDSLGEEDDPLTGEVIVFVASFTLAKFNLLITLSKMVEHEAGCFIQSLEKNPLLWCSIAVDQNDSFYDAKMHLA